MLSCTILLTKQKAKPSYIYEGNVGDRQTDILSYRDACMHLKISQNLSKADKFKVRERIGVRFQHWSLFRLERVREDNSWV